MCSRASRVTAGERSFGRDGCCSSRSASHQGDGPDREAVGAWRLGAQRLQSFAFSKQNPDFFF